MAELKTKKNAASVEDFLASVDDPQRRADAIAVDALMREVTGEPPVMWGSAIVGYGHSLVRYADGATLDWMAVGFSPRKAALALYLMAGFDGTADLLAKLGKHSTGKGCLYVKSLAKVDMAVLRALVERSVAITRAKHAEP